MAEVVDERAAGVGGRRLERSGRLLGLAHEPAVGIQEALLQVLGSFLVSPRPRVDNPGTTVDDDVVAATRRAELRCHRTPRLETKRIELVMIRTAVRG
jgi:hypothetical protein